MPMVEFNNLAYTWLDNDTFLMAADGKVDGEGDQYRYSFEYHESTKEYVFERVYEDDRMDATNDFTSTQRRDIRAYMQEQMYAKFPNHKKPLPAKYAKLRDDIRAALDATEWAEQTEDGGTCNFDSPVLYLDRWNGKLVEQAAKEAGSSAFKWRWGRTTLGWVISPRSSGQGNRRTRRAEAIRDEMKKRGYDVGMYYQMD